MSEVDLPEPLEPAARALFGDGLALARRYAELLAGPGVVRGLIGPREAPRLWERHLLNCAAVAELISRVPPSGSSPSTTATVDDVYLPVVPPGLSTTVVDVGSGAGLPGIVLAVARPDITVILVEPLARRTSFLTEVVAELGLTSRVTVVRGRAEEVTLSPAEIVTARAVAPLDKLAAWCLPLASTGGRLLAMKGESAGDEVAAHAEAIERLGGGVPRIHRCGVDLLHPPTTVVEIVRERYVARSGKRSPGTVANPRRAPVPDRVDRGRGRSRRR